jgi:hypothetical protein
MGASWPWCESGDPIVDDDAEAVDRLDEGTRISPSSWKTAGDERPLKGML